MRAVILFLSIITLCACQKQVSDPSKTDMAMVSFSVDCPGMETLTRALSPSGENAVQDLNIYLFNKNVDVIKHLYIKNQTNIFSVNLVQGDYDMFVVANHGSDMGSMTIDAVLGYERTISTEAEIESSGSLLMVAHQKVSITGVATIPVTLTRKIAKVEFKLSVAPHFASNFTLSSVQVRNAPNRVALFSTSATTSVFDYVASGNVSQFYMLENAQGFNESITDQRQKNRINAPMRATYIHIQGYAEGKKVEYCIYLGENNTSDFNVYGNKHYIINAVISGVNNIDNRVSTSELTVTNFAAEYKPGETAHGSVSLTSNNNIDNSFNLSYRILEGGGSMLINGASYPQNLPIPFLNFGEQSKSAVVSYTQSGSSPVRIAVTTTDRYGYTLTKEFRTNYTSPPTPPTPSEVTLTINWQNESGKINVWAEASAAVGSMITLDCYVYAIKIYPDNTERRGWDYYYTLEMSYSKQTSNVVCLEPPSGEDFIGVAVRMDKPKILFVNPSEDDNTKYIIKNP